MDGHYRVNSTGCLIGCLQVKVPKSYLSKGYLWSHYRLPKGDTNVTGLPMGGFLRLRYGLHMGFLKIYLWLTKGY